VPAGQKKKKSSPGHIHRKRDLQRRSMKVQNRSKGWSDNASKKKEDIGEGEKPRLRSFEKRGRPKA